MSYIWFESVLEALGKRISFESISNIYGNSFCKKPNEIVSAANPLLKHGGKDIHSGATILGMAGTIKTITVKDDVDVNKLFGPDAGDTTWAKDFILNG